MNDTDIRHINPAACIASLRGSEHAYVGIPMPPWMEKDRLRKSFDRYPELWRDGKVVWGCIVQANRVLFSSGERDAPGDVVYDPRGLASIEALRAAAGALAALKNTRPEDPVLRAIADHLTGELTRVCGMSVPPGLSQSGLLVSTLLIHRKHLPDNKLSLPIIPLLINDRMPGVATVFPSRWWPSNFLDTWLGRTPDDRRGGEHAVKRTTTAVRHCTNCRTPMRKLGLAAHYNREVEIDVCEPCSLIWFDDTESARLAGPGLADLVRIIHHAMQSPRPLEPLPLALDCPICGDALKRVSDISRFGRSAQMQCPAKHGAYQSFALFLAGKGYFRPFSWADVKSALAAGKQLACFNCGANLEPRPQDECPYCRSPVGLLDPTRLASAIDVQQASPRLSLAPAVKQTSCPCCGGALDLTAEMACPHCKAIVRPVETQLAADATQVIEASVRENYENQMPHVSRRKLATAAMLERNPTGLPSSENIRRLAIVVVALGTLGFTIFGATLQKARARMEAQGMTQDDDLRRYPPAIRDGIENARAESQMARIPHAPSGVEPPQLKVTYLDRDRLRVTNRTTQRLKVTINLVNEALGTRCKMVKAEGTARDGTATLSSHDESHLFIADSCAAEVLAGAKPEYAVWNLDEDRYVFKSDSAFFRNQYR